ncbi:DUF5050 domain-containing protein [Peribacillus sp. B-H-3]|uniref:DUF5050 domain-containing protein n=1 Tax=Peribacillus sp. B-H-3 TaxID=3400420 RepID=UPI003B029C85
MFKQKLFLPLLSAILIFSLFMPISTQKASAASSDELLYNSIYNGILHMQTKISLGKYGQDSSKITAAYQKVLDNHPEIFYTQYYFQWSPGYFYPKYIGSKSEITKMKTSLDSRVDAAVKTAKTKKTELERIVYLHDFLVNSTSYDYDHYVKNNLPQTSFTAYGALVSHKAVCDGYAKALKLLLDKADIWAIKVNGTVSSGDHAWNMVRTGGSYYYIDSTFDDPVTNDRSDVLTYKYLLVPESKLAKDHVWNKSKLHKASSTKYQKLYSLSDFVRYNSSIYYANQNDHKLYRMSLTGSSVSKMDNHPIYSLKIIGSTLYYINLADHNSVYQMKLGGTAIQKIKNTQAGFLSVKGSSLYFYSNVSNKMVKLR